MHIDLKKTRITDINKNKLNRSLYKHIFLYNYIFMYNIDKHKNFLKYIYYIYIFFICYSIWFFVYQKNLSYKFD